MARRSGYDVATEERADFLPPAGEEPKPRVRSSRARQKAERAGIFRAIWGAIRSHPRLIQNLAVAAAACLIVTAALDQLAQFLANTPWFQLPADLVEPGADSRNLEIRGTVSASGERLRQVFQEDAGSSLYFVDLAARKAALEKVDWVKTAAVSRLWPDRLRVTITERAPVAFLGAAAGEGELPVMVDSDGVLLRAPSRGGVRLSLPVLSGAGPSMAPEARKVRVEKMMRLLESAANHRDRLPEIDATDPRNLSVVYELEGHGYQLTIGDRHFAERLDTFLRYRPQIMSEKPDACGFDLRNDGWVVVTKRGEICGL